MESEFSEYFYATIVAFMISILILLILFRTVLSLIDFYSFIRNNLRMDELQNSCEKEGEEK